MKRSYLWLSGLLTFPAIINLFRYFLKMRIDVAYKFAGQYVDFRLPFTPSLAIGIICLLLVIIFYLLGKD